MKKYASLSSAADGRYPGYRYQPVYRRTNVIRRRVRKDDAEEDKCRSVAALLLEGKTGDVLEKELRDKIQCDGPAASANELSKGALRALRTQARHSTPSWSGSQAASSTGESSIDSVSWNVQDITQTFAYPSMPQYPYSYSQPMPDFYTFDQALPFSPTAGSFRSRDVVLGGGLPSPVGYGSGWDRYSPPSSEIPFPVFGLDEDALLTDFSSALEQAQESNNW